MMKRKWIVPMMGVIALLWIAVLGTAKWIQMGLNRNRSTAQAVSHEMSDPGDLKIYWDSPAFAFPDQDGQIVSNRELLGHVWVADFIFTQCTSACPILTSKMLLLQRHVTTPGVRFISFSVDPEHDTPAALKTYASLWQGDESRWRLLSTTPAGLMIVTSRMEVTAAPSGDPNNPILHSNLFFLVDVEGRVRGVYDSSESQAMTQLEEDVRTLTGNQPPAPPSVFSSKTADAERGRLLFGSMGCLACHSQPRVAPPLDTLFGGMVRLDDRRTVWADEAYVHESIVDPSAKVVAGYTKSMPSYRNYLDDQQVMNLVTYIKSTSPNQLGGHGVVSTSTATQPVLDELLTDPVCKMQVRSDLSAPHVDFNGKTYFFCSDHCREQFARKPADYVLTPSTIK